MRKIASPRQLQAELTRIMSYCQQPNPSRQVLARDLTALADRLSSSQELEDIYDIARDEFKHEAKRLGWDVYERRTGRSLVIGIRSYPSRHGAPEEFIIEITENPSGQFAVLYSPMFEAGGREALRAIAQFDQKGLTQDELQRALSVDTRKAINTAFKHRVKVDDDEDW